MENSGLISLGRNIASYIIKLLPSLYIGRVRALNHAHKALIDSLAAEVWAQINPGERRKYIEQAISGCHYDRLLAITGDNALAEEMIAAEDMKDLLRDGSIKVIGWLWKAYLYRETAKKNVRYLCGYRSLVCDSIMCDNLAVLKYCHEIGMVIPREQRIFNMLIKRQNLFCLQWYHDNGYTIISDECNMIHIAFGDLIYSLRWLYSRKYNVIFDKIALAVAVLNNSNNVIKWLQAHPNVIKWDDLPMEWRGKQLSKTQLRQMCQPTISWMSQNGYINAQYCSDIADMAHIIEKNKRISNIISRGDLGALKRMGPTMLKELCRNEYIDVAAKADRDDILEWLWFNTESCFGPIMNAAIKYDRVSLLRIFHADLARMGMESLTIEYDCALYNQNIAALDFLHMNGYSLDPDIVSQLLEKECILTLQWMYNKRYMKQPNARDILSCVGFGAFKSLKWLKSCGYKLPIDENVMVSASLFGPEMLQYLYDNGDSKSFKPSEFIIRNIIERGINAYSLDWWVEHYPEAADYVILGIMWINSIEMLHRCEKYGIKLTPSHNYILSAELPDWFDISQEFFNAHMNEIMCECYVKILEWAHHRGYKFTINNRAYISIIFQDNIAAAQWLRYRGYNTIYFNYRTKKYKDVWQKCRNRVLKQLNTLGLNTPRPFLTYY